MIQQWQFKWGITLTLLLPLLSGCGSDGGGPAPVNAVTISGVATYTDYNVVSGTGIDYSNPIEKPIRGALVSIENSNGQYFSLSTTNESGHYTIEAPENSQLFVVVYATLGDENKTNTWVIDNTDDRATHRIITPLQTHNEKIRLSFNAGSGWDGTRYSQPRVAAPFAILDVIYQAQQRILSVDPDIVFSSLAINWSELNRPDPGDTALGLIGSSHYQSSYGEIFLLGAADIDTDEYDDYVIAHEWIHHLEHTHSRSDSIGGDHVFNDIQDPTIAFSEGLADALSAIVRDDSRIMNSHGPNQASVGEWDVDWNWDPNATLHESGIPFAGYYSEISITEIIYDLYDGGPGDDDSVALGFKPIYDAMIGGHQSTPAFTSIFSFLHYLKQDQPASAGAITTLALAENISSGNEFEATTDPFYNNVTPNGAILSLDLDGIALQTRTTYGPITDDFFGHGNKLLNRLFFRINVTNAGCYTLKAIPASINDLAIYTTHVQGGFFDDFGAGETESQAFFLESGLHSYAIAGRGTAATFTTSVNPSPNACT